YALIAPGERPAMHCAIGRRLLAAARESTVSLDEHPWLFDLVARLARAAGRRASGSAAFESAWAFFEWGLGALGEHGFDADYPLWLALSARAAEAALVAGQRESMERRIAELRAHAKSL